MKPLTWIATLMLVACVAMGQTYYVDVTNGSDSNDGTSPATAWKNLSFVTTFDFTGQPASQRFPAGSKILLRAGQTHPGPLVLQWQGDMKGTNNNLVIDRYGAGSNPNVTGDGTFGCIALIDSGGVTVRNVTCTGGVSGIGLAGNNTANAAGILIENCLVTGQTLDGIRLGSSITRNLGTSNTVFRVTGTTVHSVQNDGISQLWSMQNVILEIDNCIVHDIGVGTGAPGIDAASGDAITGHSATWGLLVHDNTIYNARDGMHFVNFGTSSDVMRVWNNYIYGCTYSGIRFENTSAGAAGSTAVRKIQIDNNVVVVPQSATQQAGIAVGPKVSGGPQNMFPVDCLIANNTIHSTATSGSWHNIDILSSTDNLSRFRVLNNLSYSSNASFAKHVKVDLTGGGTPTLLFDANMYQGDNAAAFNNNGTSTAFATFALKGTGSKLLSSLGLVGDPTSSVNNAKLASTSAAMGLGLNLTKEFGKDKFSAARPATGAWDPGAAQIALRSQDLTRRMSVSRQIALTANTAQTVYFVPTVERLDISYSVISANCRLRVAPLSAGTPTVTWTGAEEGVMRTLNTSGVFANTIASVPVLPASQAITFIADQNVTINVTAYNY